LPTAFACPRSWSAGRRSPARRRSLFGIEHERGIVTPHLTAPYGTEDTIGDDVFDILRTAAKEVARLYGRELGRPPSRSEWQRLIQDALEPVEELDSSDVRSLFVENARPRSIEIVLVESVGRAR
jgi:hypothetical protein